MERAHITTRDEARRIHWIGGTVHHVLVGGEQTYGRQTLLRTTFRLGAASPVHVHDRDDETLHVIDGALTIWAGRERWRIGAGDTAFLPRGLPHAYRVDTETADVLTTCNPAGMEDLFLAAGWDLAEPLPEGWSVDMASIGPLGEQSGQHVLGPPLEGDDLIPHDMLAGVDAGR